jgi:hypothetical protein
MLTASQLKIYQNYQQTLNICVIILTDQGNSKSQSLMTCLKHHMKDKKYGLALIPS